MKTIPGHEIEFLTVYFVAHRSTRSSKTDLKASLLYSSPTTIIEPAPEPETDPATIMAEGSEDDTSYTERGRDFFKEGRLFKIAKEEDPLHLEQYILLDKNDGEQGPCLQVFTYEESDPTVNEAYFLRSHVHVQTHESKPPSDESSEDSGGKRRRVVHLDEYSTAEEGTYIKLAYTVNIPFAGYRYKDCGELDRRYLRELRSSYADWLKYYWDLD